jgi:hypothetical protein
VGAEGRGQIRGGETCGAEEDEVWGMGVNGRGKEFLPCAPRIYRIRRGGIPESIARRQLMRPAPHVADSRAPSHQRGRAHVHTP